MEGEIEPLHLRLEKAVNRNRVDFGTCLPLDVEPPFLSDDRLSIEARLSHFHTYFSNGLPGPNREPHSSVQPLNK
jgi:hypothetical protein